jgi:hypothetical protein
MAEMSTKYEFCNYVLFFGGDIKKEIHFWLVDNDFKLWGTMLDFYLQFMFTVEKTCH